MKRCMIYWKRVIIMYNFTSENSLVKKLICKKHLNQLISFGRIEKLLQNIEEDVHVLFGLLSLFYYAFQVPLFITVHTHQQD